VAIHTAGRQRSIARESHGVVHLDDVTAGAGRGAVRTHQREPRVAVVVEPSGRRPVVGGVTAVAGCDGSVTVELAAMNVAMATRAAERQPAERQPAGRQRRRRCRAIRAVAGGAIEPRVSRLEWEPRRRMIEPNGGPHAGGMAALATAARGGAFLVRSAMAGRACRR